MAIDGSYNNVGLLHCNPLMDLIASSQHHLLADFLSCELVWGSAASLFSFTFVATLGDGTLMISFFNLYFY